MIYILRFGDEEMLFLKRRGEMFFFRRFLEKMNKIIIIGIRVEEGESIVLFSDFNFNNVKD